MAGAETGALPWDRLSALIDFELNRPKEFATSQPTKNVVKWLSPKSEESKGTDFSYALTEHGANPSF